MICRVSSMVRYSVLSSTVALLINSASMAWITASRISYALFARPIRSNKATFASGFPDAVFLATESGHNALSIYKVDLPDWEAFLNTCRELVEGKHSFQHSTDIPALRICLNF